MTKGTVLKFIQVNLHKAKQGQIEIAASLRKLNKAREPFITLIQEPMTDKNRAILQPKSCQVFEKGPNPRAGIYVSNKIKAWNMETLSSPDIAVIQTRIQNRSTLVISTYLDIQNKDVIPVELITAVEYALKKGLAIIIGMDSNAHSTSFGPSTNSRGEKLDLFIAKYGLDIENRGNTPTFCGRGCATFIDVTLTRGLSVTVKEWEVCTDYNGSCLLYTSPSPRD